MKKIYCFGDGFATGHIWPEWPQLIEALFPEYKVIITAGIGAGPEYLVTRFTKLLPIDGTVIFQWPHANRFDKLIEDDFWSNLVSTDPVYHFNTYQHGTERWWLSSASALPDLKEYRTKYIQQSQSNVRLEVYKSLVEEILKKSNCPYVFTSTIEQDLFSKQSLDIRGTEIQPRPLSHLEFLDTKILPEINLHSDNILRLSELLSMQTWVPFDPNREEIWTNIKQQLTNNVDK